MDKVVVYSGTRKVYPDMVTASKSLLANSKVDRIYFVTEDSKGKFPYYIPDFFEVINVAEQKYFGPASPNRNTILTYMVLMRAAFHEIFPNEDVVLQLDCDTIVNGDISGLWDYDLTDYYFACVKEPESCKGGKYPRPTISDEYFNMGVALMNLKKLRDGKGDRLIRQLNYVRYNANEQDCINQWCRGQILEIPSDYNASEHWTAHTDNPIITHYAGVRDWRSEKLWKEYEAMSYDEALKLGGY